MAISKIESLTRKNPEEFNEDLWEIRQLADRILEKAGTFKKAKKPTKFSQRVIDFILLARYYDSLCFESKDWPELDLVLRAAVGSWSVPRLTISALYEGDERVGLEIDLKGKNNMTGVDVDVLRVTLPAVSNNCCDTTVVFWPEPSRGTMSYGEFRRTELVSLNEVVMDSLRATYNFFRDR